MSGVCHGDKSDLDTHSTSCLTSIVIDSIYNVNLLDVWGVSLATLLCRSRNGSETHQLDTNMNSLLDRGGQANLPSGGSGIESVPCLCLLWEVSHPTLWEHPWSVVPSSTFLAEAFSYCLLCGSVSCLLCPHFRTLVITLSSYTGFKHSSKRNSQHVINLNSLHTHQTICLVT